MEVLLSRVISIESAGKERTQLARAIVVAMRELSQQNDLDEKTKDLAAFIALALEEIAATIDLSVAAWEKRGYWVKADRFRMEWIWTERLGATLRQAVLGEDWGTVALTVGQVGEKLSSVKVPLRNRVGTPWQGAYGQLAKRHSP
jgi:uncharacterized protein YigA (DUF484 family)